jgi:hypothetical protein
LGAICPSSEVLVGGYRKLSKREGSFGQDRGEVLIFEDKDHEVLTQGAKIAPPKDETMPDG